LTSVWPNDVYVSGGIVAEEAIELRESYERLDKALAVEKETSG